MENKRLVIALGGNALGENKKEQREALEKVAVYIVDLIEDGYDIVVTHGNGPQVGMIQTAMDELSAKQPEYGQIPLTSSVAMSQCYIGLDIENALKREIAKRSLDKKVTTILTQVEVDADDPAFDNPTKPIGRFIKKEEADELAKQGVKLIEDSGRGYRVVVSSPQPKAVIELGSIKALLDNGHLVVACGGGGIPVVRTEKSIEEIDAVIDKDNTSALLANDLDSDFLIILTAVEKVAINFGKENEEWLDKISVAEAKEYIKKDEFGKGSMEPKVQAAIKFVEGDNNKKALITLIEKLADALDGKTGTTIVNER